MSDIPQHSSASDHHHPDFLSERADTHESDDRGPGLGTVVGWAVALVLTAVAAVVAVWQVNEQLYAPEAAAETYWDALSAGEGSEALGMFESVPEFTQDGQVDNVLLTEGPLSRSAELIDDAELAETADGAELSFTAADESYTTVMPVTHSGTTWGLFDTWEIAPAGITWFEVDVPGAPQGGIGQVQVNGEPVNLEDETTRLSAYVPTIAEISIDSQWLTGSTTHVVTAAADSADSSAEQVSVDLEASEEASERLHQELGTFFEECDQQVLMPSGCPVGTSTSHRVAPDTISWTFPEPDEFSLTFDNDGWQVTHDELVAEVSFEGVHFHTGEQLDETMEVPFDLDVEVGAGSDDLLVSISGTTP